MAKSEGWGQGACGVGLGLGKVEGEGKGWGNEGEEKRWGPPTSGGGPMTESRTGSSTSPLSSPSSVRMVSTAKKYLGGGQGAERAAPQPQNTAHPNPVFPVPFGTPTSHISSPPPPCPHHHQLKGGGCHAPSPHCHSFLGGQQAAIPAPNGAPGAHLMMKSNSEPANMRTPRRVETAPSITGAKVCSSAAAERTFLLPAAVRKPCRGWEGVTGGSSPCAYGARGDRKPWGGNWGAP